MEDHYVQQLFKGVLIRIAGNSQEIRKNTGHPHWRYTIGTSPTQYPLVSWELHGPLMPGNNGQGTNPAAEEDEFLAWIFYYGDVEVDAKGHARITLLPPPH
jgi:hypothetical protein